MQIFKKWFRKLVRQQFKIGYSRTALTLNKKLNQIFKGQIFSKSVQKQFTKMIKNSPEHLND